MKKTIFAMCLGIALSCAYSVQAAEDSWVEYGDDIGCGGVLAGFGFPLQVENYTVRAMNDMLEISFPLDEKRNVVVRKSVTPEGEQDGNGIIDISGNSNTYPVNKTIMLDNGAVFSVRGEEDNYKVVNFATENGYYSFACDEGLSIADIEHLYRLLEEAEAPKSNGEGKSIEELENERRVDGVVETVYTNECFPRTLQKKGVTKNCFEYANLGQETYCSASEIEMINEYFKNGKENDPLKDDSENFCAFDD